MTYQYPSYYHDFQCISKDCPDTCCQGWNISIDPESLKHYRRILHPSPRTESADDSDSPASHNTPESPSCSHSPQASSFSHFSQASLKPSPAFLRRFRKAIDFRRRTIRLSNRRCPLLTEKNLCGMYLHLGKDSLCRTCRIYPRHQEEFGNLQEISLSLSCPEAARIILSQKTRPHMLTRQTAKKCPSGQQVDEDMLAWLIHVRETLLNILWRTDCSLETSVSMALAFSHDLQRRYSKGCFHRHNHFCPEKAGQVLNTLSQAYLSEHATPRFTQTLSSRITSEETVPYSSCQWLSSLLKLYGTLEPVVEIWPWLINLCQNSQNIQSYLKSPFSPTAYDNDRLPEKQLLTYFIQVYFLGAIYDDNLYHKVRFAAVSCLTIRLMAGSLVYGWTDSRLIQAAYLYSRQVENYDQNLDILFHGLSTEKCFRLLPFLSFLNPEII